MTDLLSGPLPGTQERADADLAARLERALQAFNGVQAATVLVTRSSDVSEAPRNVAIQLRLSPDFSPTPAWLGTIRVFSLRTIPDLDPNALTIVDSSGRTLCEAGSTRLPPAISPETNAVDRPRHPGPWWLLAAAGAAFVLVIAGAAFQRIFIRSSPPETETPAEPPGAFDFLLDVPDERIVRALAPERPEVVVALLALAPGEVRERLTRRPDFPDALPHLVEPPDPAMAAALATVLRGRLMTS